DVWADVEEYEHAQSFGSLPGGAEGVDRFVDRPGPSADPGSGFRPAKRIKADKQVMPFAQQAIGLGGTDATVLWNAVVRPDARAALSLAGDATVSWRGSHGD